MRKDLSLCNMPSATQKTASGYLPETVYIINRGTTHFDVIVHLFHAPSYMPA